MGTILLLCCQNIFLQYENTYYDLRLNIFSMVIFPNSIWLLNRKVVQLDG